MSKKWHSRHAHAVGCFHNEIIHHHNTRTSSERGFPVLLIPPPKKNHFFFALTREKQTHQVFYVKSAQSQYRYKTPYKANPFYKKTQTQQATSSLFFRSAAAKPVADGLLSSARLYTARGGLHIVDGAEPWCGPARRLADPCVGRTSRAPSCALFHSPVPGPGHVTRYSANVPWRPRFSQLFPHRWRPREPACPLTRNLLRGRATGKMQGMFRLV